IETIHQTIQNSFGRKAYIKPCMGGSLPDYVWTKILGTPSLIVPYANADEANHSPNENLVVENFYNGINCTCDVLTSIGQTKKVNKQGNSGPVPLANKRIKKPLQVVFLMESIIRGLSSSSPDFARSISYILLTFRFLIIIPLLKVSRTIVDCL